MATVNNRLVVKTGYLAMTALLALSLSACATHDQKSKDGSEVEQVTEVVDVEEAVVVDDFEGDGMEIPLDGTSVETFDASLAMVKRHTEEANYITLQKAITYLLVYDLGAKRSREILASRLDGLNGYEVIDKVGWRKPAPGKSRAEKGSADAKIIDT
jgi:hypothetical protein